MVFNRREALGMLAATGAAPSLAAAQVPVPPTPGAFAPNWDSLVAGYSAPEWFRDAKFGIWAHWSAQCVPEEGDWYGRKMYLQDTRANRAHVARYGHPSKVGFMEIENRWKAEHWDPDRLIDLYIRAGARYFVALANHHDNFDTYDSTHHAWNAVRVGPKKDIIATWAKVARARGLRFGVSNHSAHAWHWYQPAYGYDAEGPMRGVRYDAARLTLADGVGKWWEGLDPQQLYTGRRTPLPDGIGSIAEAEAWHQRVDGTWLEGQPPNDPAYARQWGLRCRELIDNYRPDLIYFDNYGLPLGQTGLDMAAHYYNANRDWHGGRLEAVLNAKMLPDQRRMGLVADVERGGKDDIDTYPWQTDTCLGDWHYDRALYERGGYKTAAYVIHMLCDVASKNGNLLLSVPLRGDGTIDEKEERILEEIAAWMGRYGEALHGSRPWRVFREGPTSVGGGAFAEGGPQSPYTPQDVRYVRKGDGVNALVLGWPADGVARLTLFALGNPIGRGDVTRVTLPGEPTPLAFRRTRHALEVTLPARLRSSIGVALTLTGNGLTTGCFV